MTLPLPYPIVRIGLIGECMVELQSTLNGHLVQKFGGDTLNTGVYMRRLLRDEKVQLDYLTAVGNDQLSSAMRAHWRKEGVGDDKVRVLPDRHPGIYLIQTDEFGERRFLYWRSESAAKECFDGPEADSLLSSLSEYQLLYLSGITLAILSDHGRERLFDGLQKARSTGTVVAFDNNYRQRLWRDSVIARDTHRRMLQLSDFALVTWEDDVALFGFADESSLFACYADLGVPEVVLKRGAKSCLIGTSQGRREIPSDWVKDVLDTTAAGDSFSAGYLACRLQGGSIDTAARWGHRLAATVIQHPGAIIPNSLMPAMPAIYCPVTSYA
ncbi:sugar kinase [Pseudomonas benzopyrenica]|uniref:sugar kinase n=1 Tax=Pseudomonas benzopyrenica TaxID=2993566 RepID=UPI0039C2A72F